MKQFLFRSIGVSVFILSLSLFTFADGDMGAGSKTDPSGGGFAPSATSQKVNTDSTKDSDILSFDWILNLFSDILS